MGEYLFTYLILASLRFLLNTVSQEIQKMRSLLMIYLISKMKLLDSLRRTIQLLAEK